MTKQVKPDIFAEAAKKALEKTPPIKRDTHKPVAVLKPMEKVSLPGDANTEEAWAQLKESMMGVHAERFDMILGQLTGREFIKVYLTALEFFKPKIVRSDGKEKEERDRRVEVVIKRKPEKKKTA